MATLRHFFLAVIMQNLTLIYWIFLRKGFVVRSLQISVPICSSLTSRLTQKPAAQLFREVLHDHRL